MEGSLEEDLKWLRGNDGRNTALLDSFDEHGRSSDRSRANFVTSTSLSSSPRDTVRLTSVKTMTLPGRGDRHATITPKNSPASMENLSSSPGNQPDNQSDNRPLDNEIKRNERHTERHMETEDDCRVEKTMDWKEEEATDTSAMKQPVPKLSRTDDSPLAAMGTSSDSAVTRGLKNVLPPTVSCCKSSLSRPRLKKK